MDKNLQPPKLQSKGKSHPMITQCALHCRIIRWLTHSNENLTGERNAINACCVCFLGFYFTFQTTFMLKKYLSNVWGVSACHSSQERKITGFNSEIKNKKISDFLYPWHESYRQWLLPLKSLYLSSEGPKLPWKRER